MAAWLLGLAWRRLALAVLDNGGLVARASLAKAALAMARKLWRWLGSSLWVVARKLWRLARKLALGGSEALAFGSEARSGLRML